MMGWVAGTCGRWRPWRMRSTARAWPRGSPLDLALRHPLLQGEVAAEEVLRARRAAEARGDALVGEVVGADERKERGTQL